MNKKLVVLLHIFCASSSLHSMQSVLDYIQKNGKPAAKKTIDSLLLMPRMLQSYSHEPLFQYPMQPSIAFMPVALLFWLTPFAQQAILPGSILAEKENAFERAILSNNINLLKSLIAHKYDINRLMPTPSPFPTLLRRPYDTTALHIAVQRQYPEMVKILLDAGANINALDKQRHTPEFYAQIQPLDNAQKREKKLAIQKILNFYKAKRNLASSQVFTRQAQEYGEKKESAALAREAFEQHLKKTGQLETAGSVVKDIDMLIAPYHYKQYTTR